MRTYKFILVICFILILPKAKADHVAGGELGWDCLSNGKYVFHLTLYRDCGSFNPIPFTTQTLTITGNPLPRAASSAIISSIVLRPDSPRFAIRSGDLSPECNKPINQRLDCANGDNTMQRYMFYSDPIELRGTPPASGWRFDIVAACCRNSVENVAGTTATSMYRAIMYANQASPNCNNSSPRFPDVPQFIYCRGTFANFSEMAIDNEQDSLVYDFGDIYESPPAANTISAFKNGYSKLSPTPSPLMDTANRSFQLDSLNGKIKYRFVSGIGQAVKLYLMNIRVKEYRNGQLISKVQREYPLMARDCPWINNTHPNDDPLISKPFLKGNTLSSKDTVRAGDLVSISLNVIDTNSYIGNPQILRVQVIGDQMSYDYAMGSPCADPRDTTCAYIQSANPTYNAQKDIYEIVNPQLIGKQIIWQTDCSDLGPNNQARTHRFYVRAIDDFCPTPGVSEEIFEILVLPPNNPPCPLTTSIDKLISNDLKLTFYPNPSNGKVFIDRNGSVSLDYQIFNIQGKLIKRGRLAANQNQLELPDADGMYFVSLKDKSSNERTFKLIKQ